MLNLDVRAFFPILLRILHSGELSCSYSCLLINCYNHTQVKVYQHTFRRVNLSLVDPGVTARPVPQFFSSVMSVALQPSDINLDQY